MDSLTKYFGLHFFRPLACLSLAAAPVYAQTPTSTPMPPAAPAVANAALGNDVKGSLALRIDCLHHFNRGKGASQDCAEITGLRYSLSQSLSPAVIASLRLDPFATMDASRAETPLRDDLLLVHETNFALVDQWALTWIPRPNLEVALESYDGAVHMPSVSGLSLANAYAQSGWKQSALTLTYRLFALPDMQVQFAFGNGEGEYGQNLDAQQYFGFAVEAQVLSFLWAGMSASFDGNDVGSLRNEWLTQRYIDDCGYTPGAEVAERGYSTQRLGVGLVASHIPNAEGLNVGLGWQRHVMSDLDENSASGPSLEDLRRCPRLDLDHVFVEAEDQSVNTVQRTVTGVSAAYTFPASYFVGVDFTSRRLDTGSVKLLANCSEFTGTTCTTWGDAAYNSLVQNSFTIGGGMDLAERLKLTLEYNKRDLDRAYAQAAYPNDNGKATATIEYFNARIAYNWL